MTPFVIVADLRTGSTLLSTSLNRHPEIRCYGELFHPEDFPDNQLDAVSRHELSARQLVDQALAASGFKAVGFRAMVFLPLDSHPRWADAWQCLAERDELRVIWLTRRDRLSQYVSMLVAEHTGVYHPFDNDPLLRPENRPTITVDPQQFRHWVEERDRLAAERRAWLAARPALELDYETLTERWPEVVVRVQEFLGVTIHPLAQGKRKQETRPLAEIIANYHELR
jgi:LPS sulfotransferase NodH